MISKRTLLVVGAGASCEAGLPSGFEIKQKIARSLNIKYEYGVRKISGSEKILDAFMKIARQRGFSDIDQLTARSRTIADNLPVALSIDNFLDAHREDELMNLCGKIGIAESILEAESLSKLRFKTDKYPPKFEVAALHDTWYVKLFQVLTENVPRSQIAEVFKAVTIITFNYDRCIEQFFPQLIQDYYGVDHQVALDVFNHMQIIHVYGYLGDLPWKNPNLGVQFGDTEADLVSIASRLRTFTEGLKAPSLMESIRETTSSAEQIIFLGFAFHPMNMEILNPHGRTRVSRIYASNYRMSVPAVQVAKARIEAMFELPVTGMTHRDKFREFEMFNGTCAQLIEEYFPKFSL